MQIEIKNQIKKSDGSHSFELSTEKKSAFIHISSTGYINVLCKNAAHCAYRGMGRFFWHGWDEALAAYKSSDMKAMIQLAKELCN